MAASAVAVQSVTTGDLSTMPKDLDEKELFLDWLEAVDRCGPTMPLSQMSEFLQSAPESARSTREFIYLEGLFDGRMLHEELGGV